MVCLGCASAVANPLLGTIELFLVDFYSANETFEPWARIEQLKKKVRERDQLG